MALFTRYIDKDREGTEWGVYYTLLDLGSAALAVIGGYIVTFYGFYNLIIVMSIISILGSLLLIPIKYSLKKSK
jgi:predicted MFS family arabinose efflux permease